jgi:hypothetical protein
MDPRENGLDITVSTGPASARTRASKNAVSFARRQTSPRGAGGEAFIHRPMIHGPMAR